MRKRRKCQEEGRRPRLIRTSRVPFMMLMMQLKELRI